MSNLAAEFLDGINLRTEWADVFAIYYSASTLYAEMMAEHWHETLFGYVTSYPGYVGLSEEILDNLMRTRDSRLRLIEAARSERAQALEDTWEADPEWLEENQNLIRALMAWP